MAQNEPFFNAVTVSNIVKLPIGHYFKTNSTKKWLHSRLVDQELFSAKFSLSGFGHFLINFFREGDRFSLNDSGRFCLNFRPLSLLSNQL